MKIEIAKSAGFCMGVRRAVEMVLDAANKNSPPIYSFGPLIHNPQVLSILEEKGISILKEIPDKGHGTVLIRAHGVPPEVKQQLRDAGFSVIDATCPHVIKVQTIIRKHAQKGYASIIVGDKDHPEVVGLLGYARDKGYVVSDMEELEALPLFEKAILVAQTTQNSRQFKDIQQWAGGVVPHYKLFNTICGSTERRQTEVMRLSETVDAVIVVGGHNSGNTTRLAEIVRQAGKPVYHIETEEELIPDEFLAVQDVGITAGASTPNWIIKKVYRSLESILVKKRRGWRSAVLSIQRTLLLTGIYLSLGAGSICYACLKLQGDASPAAPVLIAMLYVLSMHMFNNLTGRKADQYNDPDRAFFYNRYRPHLTMLAVTAGVAGLMVAVFVGWIPFLILLAMSGFGVSYNLRLIPVWINTGQYRRIRDIPGSKTVLIAAAWGLVTCVVPAIALSGAVTLGTALVFFWATCLVFTRTAFFDLLDIQGDRIVGRETIPILLGEKKTIRLLKTILVCSIGILLISTLFQMVSPLGYGLLCCSVLLYVVLNAYSRGRMLTGVGLEFLIESHLLLAGLITAFWSLI
jgi:(E)-4-hydroxy-3-methyl-but-2-enyl pyrophosphate reductase